MTSDVVWPDWFGEEAFKEKINQVVIYLVTHDKIVIDSLITKAITIVHIWYTSTLVHVYGLSEKSLDLFNTFDILVEPGVPNLGTTFQKRTYIYLVKTHKD